MANIKKAIASARGYFCKTGAGGGGWKTSRGEDGAPIHPTIWLAEAACRQQYLYHSLIGIHKDVKKVINNLLDSHPNLLSEPPHRTLVREGEECDTIWRWLVKTEQVVVVAYVAYNARQKNWSIPVNATDQKNGSSLFTDPSITMSYDMFCVLHCITGEVFDGAVNKMTNESVLHILAKKNDVYGNGMALKIMKEMLVDSCGNTDPDLVDKVEGKTALDYALDRGDTVMAWVLVNSFGADWGLAEAKLGADTAVCVKSFLEECRRLYGIQPNFSSGATGEGNVCFVCLEDVSQDTYKMDCCGNFTHAECLRKSLKRPIGGARCMLCRRDLCGDLFTRMPSAFRTGLNPPLLPALTGIRAETGRSGARRAGNSPTFVARASPAIHVVIAAVACMFL